MDRSIQTRVERTVSRAIRRTLAIVILLSMLPLNAAAEEGNGPKPKPPEKELVSSTGLYLGRLVRVDEKFRFIFVSPLSGNGHRRTFYLDSRTLLREMRKPVKKERLVPGRRVGIRFLREDDVAVAEGVFLIVGEVNPRDFQMPKKKRKKEEGEKEKEKAGGHGAAPPKKSGGH